MDTPSLALAALLLATPWAAGCGGDDEQTGATTCAATTTDGKLHPTPNGTHISETDACNQLQDAFDAQFVALHCAIGTTPVCPSLLRRQWGTPNLEYDQGTVAACAAAYGDVPTCDALLSGKDTCIVTPYPTPEPDAGCR